MNYNNQENNSAPKNQLDNLEILVIDTATNKMILAVEHDGKHYRAFVNEKQMEGRDGKVWSRKTATLATCNWKDCRICAGNGTINKQSFI